MNARNLFVVFSLIGWSIALAAIYQWSQPAVDQSVTSHSQPYSQSSPIDPEQTEQPTHYLLPPDGFNNPPQPQFYQTPLHRHDQPQVVEM